MRFRLLAAAAAVLLASQAAQATPVVPSVVPWVPLNVSLGVAADYSGFFFSDVTGGNDAEGRLAVGGNLTKGLSIGQRVAWEGTGASAHPSSKASLVVGGNVATTSGYLAVRNGSTDKNWDPNGGIGPAGGTFNMGKIVYGGTFSAGGGTDNDPADRSKNASYVDFTSTKTTLEGLSGRLTNMTTTHGFRVGTVTGNVAGANTFLLDGGVGSAADVYVFNLGNATNIAGITLANISSGARIVINDISGTINLSGNLGSNNVTVTDKADLGAWRSRVLWNFQNATTISAGTFINGSILATKADINAGSGHIEGTTVANKLSTNVELGWEAYDGTQPIPEPETYALMLAGLVAVGAVARRRRAA